MGESQLAEEGCGPSRPSETWPEELTVHISREHRAVCGENSSPPTQEGRVREVRAGLSGAVPGRRLAPPSVLCRLERRPLNNEISDAQSQSLQDHVVGIPQFSRVGQFPPVHHKK